ncbi:hypothetical protein GDO81_002921 [Engystomops pustulosus]|uniref:Secreted protein n=1 Tax=Engystomops pustulosus TaxID=76066 RepID=A0AAV7DRF1_ENGPU|nr:hypothetical protein GDO81_002921 [Engystomops pustulosus]KAG8599182.1 hypothetical protein GDO81_002921 [Engystomops pustulosus]
MYNPCVWRSHDSAWGFARPHCLHLATFFSFPRLAWYVARLYPLYVRYLLCETCALYLALPNNLRGCNPKLKSDYVCTYYVCYIYPVCIAHPKS